MASIQFTDVQARPAEFLDLTSLTPDEFHQLVPPFETAFQAHLATWRLDGKSRIAQIGLVTDDEPKYYVEQSRARTSDRVRRGVRYRCGALCQYQMLCQVKNSVLQIGNEGYIACRRL